MTSQLEFVSVSNSEEAQRLRFILNQCFNFPLSDSLSYWQSLGTENFRAVRQSGQLLGGLVIYQMGQWFGSQQLPMAGIAAVGVAPEYRGTGVVTELLRHTLRELYANGAALSVLYAATQRPYRKVGYEQAGNYCAFKLAAESINLDLGEEYLKKIRSIPMRSVVPISHEVFHDIYRQKAIQNNGNLERNRAIWERLVQPRKEEVMYAYLVGSETQPQGYIIFNQKQEGQQLQLVIKDWVALTPAAGRRLWMFLGDHRSIIKEVLWHGSAIDPFLSLLSEQTYKIIRLERWLLRILDVPKALSKRGYPVGVEAELHLKVRDNLLPENNGNFLLAVSGGQGEVTRGGRGELQLDVRGLAPLYTGLFTPYQLQVTGQLEGSEKALSVASQLFAGSEPWMSDFF
ncbi:MAG: GNAT family N-acetyltransferase [Aphanothece sp. CMT-3BRIN-NPC111]|jgi:predicted acetyltransferase|nr:GNAT family N-acetyltransferase [Aphanothece sp. CMT-3BRIN-NPC111]